MYYPYFRGKQYELITIRESVSLLAEKKFVPIIEPVKEQLSGLKKTLEVTCENDASAVVIVNPQIGDHKTSGEEISSFLKFEFEKDKNIIKGILLTEGLTVDDAVALIDEQNDSEIALIHSGFSRAKGLAAKIVDRENISTSIFLDDFCGKLYRRHFKNHEKRILIGDGFQPRRNRDHPEVEFFSDLHITYDEEGMDGFGDFLIVGDDYSETGGPAYTVAIHLTFIDSDKDDEMHIHHFKSIRQDTPKDPAGKFAEALNKLINELGRASNKISETSSIKEFRSLHARRHYPGLGFIKKLSMKHHIETLAGYPK